MIELTVIKVNVRILDPSFSLQPNKTHYYLASNTIVYYGTKQHNNNHIVMRSVNTVNWQSMNQYNLNILSYPNSQPQRTSKIEHSCSSSTLLFRYEFYQNFSQKYRVCSIRKKKLKTAYYNKSKTTYFNCSNKLKLNIIT